MKARVLIVDDARSAGTAARESIAIIRAAGNPGGSTSGKTTENGSTWTTASVRSQLGLPGCAIARLSDLLHICPPRSGGMADHHTRVLGVSGNATEWNESDLQAPAPAPRSGSVAVGSGVVAAQTANITPAVGCQGQKVTSDRPITDCLDREQLELNPSGTVRRKVAHP